MLALSLLSAALIERWLQVCRVKTTFGLLQTNWFASTRMNSQKCLKLESERRKKEIYLENPRSFEKYRNATLRKCLRLECAIGLVTECFDVGAWHLARS
jgi:hypothetical protein